ncbi:MAG: YraN family protein [Candidatus Levybacteria bacterium]|nr:YraN family protein [Candidatus Levybacteria bacterium]
MKISNPTARLGEDKACEFLKRKGYKIIERNFRRGYGELDIIATDPSARGGQVLVFVEVKTRSSDNFGTPFDAIAPWKLRPLIKTAQFYKMTHKNLPEQMRIDAIGIDISGSELKIEHIENITS